MCAPVTLNPGPAPWAPPHPARPLSGLHRRKQCKRPATGPERSGSKPGVRTGGEAEAGPAGPGSTGVGGRGTSPDGARGRAGPARSCGRGLDELGALGCAVGVPEPKLRRACKRVRSAGLPRPLVGSAPGPLPAGTPGACAHLDRLPTLQSKMLPWAPCGPWRSPEDEWTQLEPGWRRGRPCHPH